MKKLLQNLLEWEKYQRLIEVGECNWILEYRTC